MGSLEGIDTHKQSSAKLGAGVFAMEPPTRRKRLERVYVLLGILARNRGITATCSTQLTMPLILDFPVVTFHLT